MGRTKLLILGAAVVLGAAACGDSAEERLVEELIERSGDGVSDVDFDSDSGEFNITFEGEDGEDVNIVSQGEDGEFNMTIEGEDGESFTFGGGDVPEDLQTTIVDGGKVTQSYTSDNDRSVALEYPKNKFEELVATYDAALGDDDISRSESTYSNDDGTIRSVTWYGNSGRLNVSVSDCYSISSGELSSVCVTIYEIDD